MARSRVVNLTTLLVCVALVVTIFVSLRLRPKPAPHGGGPEPAADPVKAMLLLNEGLALLENGQADAAAEKFGELKVLAPAEPAVARNLAIAAVLAIAPETLDKVRSPEKFQSGLARAEEAVTKLRALEPKLPAGALLAARLAEHREDRTKQLEFLQEAATLADGNPVFEAEVFLASRASDSPDAQAKGLVALKRAGEKATDNLWLLTELIVAQATSQDADIVKTIARLRDASGPFVEFVKKLRNVDLLDLLDKAQAATESGDWNTVTRNARLVSNLLRPEIATKLDQRRLVKHPLEYVVADFSAEWHVKHDAQLAKGTAPSAAPIEVTFAEAAPSDQLPALAGIRDAKIADFDLDGRWDVVVLLSGQVIVFGQGEESPKSETRNSKDTAQGGKASRWVTLCEAVVPNGMTKLLVSDLDRDTEETPDEHRFIGQTMASSVSKEKTPDGAAERVEDADPDVLVYGADGVQFLRNQYDKGTKSRSLQQVAQDAAFDALRDVLAIAPADIDHDGDLDLVVSSNSGMSIWQNNDSREHTKFADITSRSALPPSDLKATVLLPVDWNFDVQTDVLVTGPGVETPGYLENISHGRLRWREHPAGHRSAKAQSLHLSELGISPLGWNLLVTTQEAARLIDGSTGELLSESQFPKGLSGCKLADFDNDGHRDWLLWDSSQAYRNIRTHEPKQASAPENNTLLPMPTMLSRCEIADFDADGDEDVLVVTNERPVWIRNDGGNKNGWIDISIRADKDRKPQRDSERVNAHGVGSVIELRAAGLANMPGRKSHVRVVEGQSTHFGLGPVKQVDAVRIIWTNGIPQNVIRPRAGEAIAAQQTLKGSCPYLYTWDGEQWAFYTDCLWAAPIGLQFAEGVLAPCREWEYLKIDGERLRETNGEYRVMLTEELWEAAYLDQVRLLAVDHPADVEFFSNEKVGPPSISEFKLHPVRKRRTPVNARDHRGRDVLPKLAQRDEQYLRAFDKIIQQGLAEEHFIELDLGDIRDAKNVTLFLTGWIFPTDTSINVSLSQNPDRDGPKPPSIWVPAGDEGEIGREGDGETGRRGETKWREAISYIGFPGGKTKTIAVDVTEALGLNESGKGKAESGKDADNSPLATRHSPLKLRIVTSMELYWDEMFFTVDEPPLEQTTTELPLVAADLQFRGFSARLPHPEFGPERYDAAKVITEPQWPPMGGRFTRYGDVTELLTETDDRMAVFGAGDAVTIRFRADRAPKLPPGWKRDFIIHNVGYDKDADLNTIYGQFVEPLPFRAMRGYPDPTGAEYPDTPAHREYLHRFQTREQLRQPFWLGN